MDSKKSCFGVILLLEIILTDASIYVSNPTRSRMVEFQSNTQPCRIITQRDSIMSALQQADPNRVHMVTSQELDDLTRSCTGPHVRQPGGFIFPGTKWCGPGNIASGYDDLGTRTEVDRCCRDHDHCPMSLEPGQCRRGICNISPFTRSHCDCDIAFKKCLRQVNNREARLIGNIYFNIVQVTCFKDRRSCPQWMRNDLSYTWFCEEWKFVPVDDYVQPPEEANNQTVYENEIPNKTRQKPIENSKIDRDLHELYGADADIEKIMDNPKSTSKV